jgi:ankyrin repeat protein
LEAHVTAIETFIDSAVWHGGLERANAMLVEHPTLAGRTIFTAAILGDDAAVRRFLAADPGAATTVAGPHGATALVYLCFSNYLRLEPARTPAFVSAATALLDAGADPNIRDDKYGATALGWANFFSREELATLVREKGGSK